MKAFNQSNGDLVFTGGQLTLVSGGEYVRQKIETRLRMFLAEWYLDRRLGFPWLERVLGQRNPPLEPLLRDAISTILDVATVTAVRAEYDNPTRTYNLSYQVVTVEGEIVSGGVPFVVGG